ncbi:FtsX-like permease family protein [Microtetraspora niveoalba]|uniref:FtsX-like permease family protein n=1 Tax=Microtetraspora niveoalba TaxID=46175 RepID=UPI00082DA4A6|nr:FtsX-like permease family protein [Microtetraspora niveoalba]
MSSVRAALRIARRDAWRAKGRSLLVMIMIGLPVLAFTVAATYTATRELDPRERIAWDLGSAAAMVTDTEMIGPIRQNATRAELFMTVGSDTRPPLAEAEIAALFGPDTRVVRSVQGHGEYQERDGYQDAVVREVDARDPVTQSVFHLIAGRFPQAEDEVAVSDAVGVPVGSVLRVTRADLARRVVGVVAAPPVSGYVVRQIITPPGALLGRVEGLRPESRWLVDARGPITWELVRQANLKGLTVLSRAVLDDPPPIGDGPDEALGDRPFLWNDAQTVALVTAILVIEVVLLAGPAFAVGLRRRRRELALIAAQGGSARHLKIIVIAEGLTLGAGASVLGAVLGVGVARVVVGVVGLWPAGELGPFDVPVGQVALVVALGTLSGLVAAIVPAVQAARWDVPAALAGRRDARRDRAGRPLLGALLVVLGLAALAYGVWSGRNAVLGGVLLGQLGLVLVMPWLIGRIGALAGRLPLPLRLAVRDGARNRGRTAPAVAAVMAATAAFSTISIVVASETALRTQTPRSLFVPGTTAVYGTEVTEESWREIRPIVEKTLPGVPLVEGLVPVNGKGQPLSIQVRDHGCAECMRLGGPLGELPLGGPDLLRYVLGRTDPGAEAALAAGRAVVFDPGAVRNGELRLTLSPYPFQDEQTAVSLPTTLVRVEGPTVVLGVAPASAFTSRGYGVKLAHLLVDPQVRRVTVAEEARLQDPIQAVTSRVAVMVAWERDGQRGSLVFAIAMAVIVLGATFTATALAAADTRKDLDILSATGARPRTRRAVVAGQAAFIAGIGVPAGVVAGLAPGAALAARALVQAEDFPAAALNSYRFASPGFVFAVPWPQLAAMAVGLPLLAALVAGVFARTRVRLSRRVA